MMFVPATRNQIFAFGCGALLIVAVLAAYGNTLHSPFVLDDYHNILHNSSIRIQALDLDTLAHSAAASNPARNRPVASLSFALNYLVGGDDPFGYHLVNICIHLATALVVYRLYRWYLRRRGGGADDASVPLAAAAALIWAVSPVQTSAVTYIVQRMTSLSALFFLMSLLCYLHARERVAAHGFSSRRRITAGFLLCSLLLWLLALLTKENAAIMPAIIALHEACFFNGLSRRTIRRRKYLYLSLFLLGLALLGGILAAGFWQSLVAGYGERDFTMGQRLLTQSRVVLHYFSLFLWPLPSRLALYYDFPLSRSLLDPPSTLVSLFTLAGLAMGSALLARRWPLVTFGLFWTLLCLLIESTFIPLEMVFEHRFYLPSVGFTLALAAGFAAVLRHLRWHSLTVPLMITLGFAFTLATHARNQDWRSEITLHEDAVRKAPNLARAGNGLAVAYLRAGRQAEARTELERVLALEPKNVVALANLFLLSSEFGSPAQSASFLGRLQQTVLAGHFTCKEIFNLSMIAQFLQDRKRCDLALTFFSAMDRCATVSANPLYHYNRGRCLAETGEFGAARASFEEALARDEQNPTILLALARVCFIAGEKGEVAKFLQRLREFPISPALAPQVAHLEQELQAERLPAPEGGFHEALRRRKE